MNEYDEMEEAEEPKESIKDKVEDLTGFLEDLKKKPINHVDFKEKAKELNGMIRAATTSINNLTEDISEIRREFEPRYRAVKDDYNRKQIDIGKIEPLGDIFVLQLQYINKMRNLYVMQHHMLVMLIEWDKQLESALEMADGIKISSDFLDRTEKFTNKCVDLVVKNAEIEKSLIEDNRKAMQSIANTMQNMNKAIERNSKEFNLAMQMANQFGEPRKQKKEKDEFPEENSDEFTEEKEESKDDDRFDPLPEEDNAEELTRAEIMEIRKLDGQRNAKKSSFKYVVEHHKSWDMEKARTELKKAGVRIPSTEEAESLFTGARLDAGLE
jgi:hypothetical protein